MKYLIITTLLLSFFCNAQQTELPIETEWVLDYTQTNNKYFKDINNVLNKFEGTWKYEDMTTNTVFEITFTKILHQEGHKNGFVDELICQFKLTINGIEQYNTYTTPCADCFIPSGFATYTEGYENGAFIYTQPNVNMYVASIAEPDIEDDVLASDLKLVYQYDTSTAIEVLIWTNKVSEGTNVATGGISNVYKMPLNMILIKQ
jgi:hypothetical protein